jgi:hypothetical protein
MNMGKIEEIKERHSPGAVIPYRTPWDTLNVYKSDVEYLLSRLQIAEEALKDARDFLRLEEKWEAAKFIDKALEQIGE